MTYDRWKKENEDFLERARIACASHNVFGLEDLLKAAFVAGQEEGATSMASSVIKNTAKELGYQVSN